MKFQLNQLPCSHAIRACRERDLSIYTVASRLYTLECLRMAYAIPVNPVQHRSEGGRRKNKRIPSQGEEITRKRCGRCREYGHNKKTCIGNYVPMGTHDK
ncbi:hypothetical protein LIER_02250 [Lithospermum erythrorhizon]|uniref:Zinc finger protein n=1 Tax=Lithospermum erythrorhizon TaxID=34254 RepID=A0AAV3NPV4_LITER